MSPRWCLPSTPSRIRRTWGPSCAAQRPRASTASCSRRAARPRCRPPRSRRPRAPPSTSSWRPSTICPGTLADLHVRGLRIVGTDAGASLTYRDADLRGPLVLVVGSEGRGLAPPVRRRCDLLVRIPMRGHIESLNAAVAGSVLVFEAAAQRGLPERPSGDEPPVPAPGIGDPAAAEVAPDQESAPIPDDAPDHEEAIPTTTTAPTARRPPTTTVPDRGRDPRRGGRGPRGGGPERARLTVVRPPEYDERCASETTAVFSCARRRSSIGRAAVL